ncbi:MAG: hypothetical protein HGB10_04580 [Coriobacteriia bacterium]|nr:hypothetical protein [Coriobacteriia bacterium]
MNTRTDSPTFRQVLDELVASALLGDVSEAAAARARKATGRALGYALTAPANLATRRRASAYFSACVRRETVRGRAGSTAAARMLAAAIVEDLLEGGRDGWHAWEALDRGWRGSLPDELLEEYRIRLCGAALRSA